jgi:glycosyltransferase involved in cell wall biosynthesis
MKILHMVGGLGRGGTEMMLVGLVRELQQISKITNEVISLTDLSGLAPELQALNVPLYSVGIRGGTSWLVALSRLRRLIRDREPDVLQAWMYHSNVASVIAAPSSVPIVWGIHHSLHDAKGEKRLTRALIKGGRLLARYASAIVYCSAVSADQHARIGYSASKQIVIPNGFDTEKFAPNDLDRREMRLRLGIPPDCIAIGNAARFHPTKNHSGLISAFAQLIADGKKAILVMAGRSIDEGNEALSSLIGAAGVQKAVRLLGERRDVQQLMRAFDVYVSSSIGEAFPIVLGEAMASGTPCIATDVGDSRDIVGDTGWLVPPHDTNALGNALRLAVEFGHERLLQRGATARERIEKRYSLPLIARKYAELYANLCS